MAPSTSLPFPPPPPVRHHGNTYTHAHPNPGQTPSDRQKHLQYLHSLLHILLQRHPTLPTQEEEDGQASSGGESLREKNAVRVGRIVRILWGCKEWREGELWREGLAWAGLDIGEGEAQAQESGEEDGDAQADQGDPQSKRRRLDSVEVSSAEETGDEARSRDGRSRSPSHPESSRASSMSLPSEYSGENTQTNGSDAQSKRRERARAVATAERRIEFLRKVAARRRGLRPLMLACRAQELIVLGRWKEALDEIELVLQSPAYRSSPELNLYAGLLVVLVSSEETHTA
ncbi:hypothetical protein BCV69DRAFT_62675 [Microstroma glucosiphilum]|uniref:Uncharacterized protein n=1 Tax=Pseudomicrostroma glucosiphilum TaxID=1684307 RepID=A0A316U0A6_9BASI|nr:hypothetical protein BCV69DRAFT_62675 [Pseudomicrostroma glucosiphilum]PWN18777.1 hypothetical protein BCV69DRAFT_62675 [Pseudomicrostroma glucosiphilum]